VKSSAIRPVEDLEKALCAYTGSPYAVAVSSCSIALEMICAFLRVGDITIPRRTYASVPQAIVKSGGRVFFRDIAWVGAYRLEPSPIWDCAPRFTQAMYQSGTYQCLSFHRRKILGHTEGGAILCDNGAHADILRIMRHDGRPPGQNAPIMLGYHAVMTNGVAAELLLKEAWKGPHEDMPFDEDYPDLSLTDWNKLWAEQQRKYF
jgi:dTDP-4-amino-4,6-dideoxygalactose transaminase